LENNAASNTVKAGFYTNLLLLKNCTQLVWIPVLEPETEPETEPEPEPDFSKVGTGTESGTAINHHGSTTLIPIIEKVDQ
jgi:hypothetical protein